MKKKAEPTKESLTPLAVQDINLRELDVIMEALEWSLDVGIYDDQGKFFATPEECQEVYRKLMLVADRANSAVEAEQKDQRQLEYDNIFYGEPTER